MFQSMTLIERINKDLKKAILSKDKLKLESLRAVKASLVLHRTSNSSNDLISQEDEIKILQKLVKQRRDSACIYDNQNRADLAKLEEEQANFISTYLPKQFTTQEIEIVVSETISELNAYGLKDMGKVIGVVVKKIQGKSDGKTISKIVKEKLSDKI